MAEQILVIKHGALGDVVQGVDAFASLRSSYPDAQITLLTTAPYAVMLKASNWFDEIIVDHRAPTWNIAELRRLWGLFRQPWTKVIDLQCSRRTTGYARMVRKDTRWFGTAPSATDPMPDFTGVNNRDRMLTAVNMAGAQQSEADLSFLQVAGSTLLEGVSDYAVILPGTSASKPSKRWPIEGYVQLAEALASRGIKPVLGGSEVDRPVTANIAEMCSACVDLTGQTDLFSLAKLIAGAAFVIGNDTGPVFMAARLHVPTLMLMGGDTDPAMSAPYGRQAHWIKRDSLGRLSFDEVWAELSSLLER